MKAGISCFIICMKLLLPLCLLHFFMSHGQEHYMLIGTYDSPKSEGIYVYRFNSNTGKAMRVSHIRTSNPSFLAVSPGEDFVYAVQEAAPKDGKGGDIAAFAFDKKNGTLRFINRQLSGGDHPCHVELDKTGRWLFASNYSSGTLSVLPVLADGSLGSPTIIRHSGRGQNPQRQKGPHVHGAIMNATNDQLIVTDLGVDKIFMYSFDARSGKLVPSSQPFVESVAGSGPRLFSFHPGNKLGYVIEELSGTVSVYDYRNNSLYFKQRISTLVPDDSSFAGSADIHPSPDGKFLYASNRGDVNTITIFRIKKDGTLIPIDYQSTLGKAPRNFSLDPTGKFLLCENQNSDEVIIFKRNKKTGMLTDSGNRMTVGKPVCIKWISIK